MQPIRRTSGSGLGQRFDGFLSAGFRAVRAELLDKAKALDRHANGGQPRECGVPPGRRRYTPKSKPRAVVREPCWSSSARRHRRPLEDGTLSGHPERLVHSAHDAIST